MRCTGLQSARMLKRRSIGDTTSLGVVVLVFGKFGIADKRDMLIARILQ